MVDILKITKLSTYELSLLPWNSFLSVTCILLSSIAVNFLHRTVTCLVNWFSANWIRVYVTG